MRLGVLLHLSYESQLMTSLAICNGIEPNKAYIMSLHSQFVHRNVLATHFASLGDRITHQAGSGRSFGFPAGSGKQVQRGRRKQEASGQGPERRRGGSSEQWRPFWKWRGVIERKRRSGRRREFKKERKEECFPGGVVSPSIRKCQDR